VKETVRNALLWFRFNVWERIPRKARTVINVLLGAAFAAVVQQYLAGNTDFDSIWDALLIAVGTVLARMLNPADDYAGIIVSPHPEDETPAPIDPADEPAPAVPTDPEPVDEVVTPTVDTSGEQAGEPGFPTPDNDTYVDPTEGGE
jgi:hypothetical protein